MFLRPVRNLVALLIWVVKFGFGFESLHVSLNGKLCGGLQFDELFETWGRLICIFLKLGFFV